MTVAVLSSVLELLSSFLWLCQDIQSQHITAHFMWFH
uniref:Uncharacterized protein n=1 Tax=Anguilla anguilla TaxID=7936 RepID=A0A0E9VDM2_ANGAN